MADSTLSMLRTSKTLGSIDEDQKRGSPLPHYFIKGGKRNHLWALVLLLRGMEILQNTDPASYKTQDPGAQNSYAGFLEDSKRLKVCRGCQIIPMPRIFAA